MKVAIVGCGLIGQKRAISLKNKGKVTFCADQIAERAKALADRAGIKKVVIGKTNNDVPIGDLTNDGDVYEKLGGFVHEQMLGSKREPRGTMHLEALYRPVAVV